MAHGTFKRFVPKAKKSAIYHLTPPMYITQSDVGKSEKSGVDHTYTNTNTTATNTDTYTDNDNEDWMVPNDADNDNDTI
eukprot:Awhi_evm1s5010